MSERRDAASRAELAFQSVFGSSPTRGGSAPGRVNLIGEHTDYTGGFVLPIAIEQRCAAVGRASDGRFRAHAADLDESIEFDPTGDPSQLSEGTWGRYVAGVIAGFIECGWDVPAMDICVATDVPLGGGLSSSAALEVAVANLVMGMCDRSLEPQETVLLCQRAEHEWAGVPCGVMDQMASVLSRDGHAVLIDCQSMATQHVPMPSDDEATLAVFNTNVKHALADGEYAKRRAACDGAVAVLGVESLRDATLDMIEGAAGKLSDDELRCARHVVGENDRTVAATEALGAGDLARFGTLMYGSHTSLRDDMRVSCEELDTIVKLAGVCDGVFGARMTGGGFGGCAIALVKPEHYAAATQAIAAGYKAAHGRDCTIIPARAAAGAGTIAL